MLDIKFVRENPELVKQNIKNKFQNNTSFIFILFLYKRKNTSLRYVLTQTAFLILTYNNIFVNELNAVFQQDFLCVIAHFL